MMNRKRIAAATIGVVLLGGGIWFYRRADARETPAYRYATIERGSLTAAVSATGTLGAERTVQVGTQVSGQIAALYVDFNDHVRKGQLLARIDPTLQQQAVQDAQAQLERAEAQLAQARAEYERNQPLYEAKYVTATEFGVVKANYVVAQTSVKSARVALDRARQNLAYTSIHSPIDGIIVERNVDVGQTVAASLSAPQLFLIANDLSEMQILASVDESDIGSISEGQKATFTVQSYPNRTFEGSVKQVRLQSKTQDNVVNYTAVVSVPNPGNRLLPGMTATVEFVTGQAENVLTVPNGALRLRATDAMRAEAGLAATDSTRPDSARRAAWAARGGAQGGGAGGTRQAGQGGGQGRGRSAMLWYVGKDGKVAATRVRTGITDGQRTEVSGEGLVPGMQVIVGTTTAGAASATPAATNPLQPQRPQGMRGPGGGF